MTTHTCGKCGYPLTGTETRCPECGVRLTSDDESASIDASTPAAQSALAQFSPVLQPGFQPNPDQFYYVVVKTNWAQYFYECGVIAWETFKKFISFSGRASRREFWSYLFIGHPVLMGACGVFAAILGVLGIAIGDDAGGFLMIIGYLSFLIPFLMILGVTIRRYHDINRCGWWCLVPIVCFFFLFKESDKGYNNYGEPEPAEDMLR